MKLQIIQFGPECDGYKNITGYIKKLNTITKKDMGEMLTHLEEVLKSKSLKTSSMVEKKT